MVQAYVIDVHPIQCLHEHQLQYKISMRFATAAVVTVVVVGGGASVMGNVCCSRLNIV